MLNHEGWCLLMILCGFITLLLIELPRMGTEQTVEKRLIAHGGWLRAAAGTALRLCGVMLLAVVPGTIYRGGWMRLGLAVWCAAGIAVLLCVLLPQIKKQNPQALTLCQAVAWDKIARAEFAGLAAIAALLSASGAIAMVARLFAYVFSLHYHIALGVSTAFALLLTLLFSTKRRRRLDKLQIVLVVLLLLGTSAAAAFAGDGVVEAEGLIRAVQGSGEVRGAAVHGITDLLAGVCAVGLVLPAQRLFSEADEGMMRKGGRAAAICMAVLLMLAAACGFAGRAASIKLETIPAAETLMTQIAELPGLPEPVSGMLTAVLVTTLLLFTQSALRFVGVCIACDVVLPLKKVDADRPIVRVMDAVSLLACVLTFPLAHNANTPLMWTIQSVLLCGAVLGSTLVLKACGAKVQPKGQRIGLAAGAAAVLLIELLPIRREFALLGAIPVLAATVLPQLLVKKRAAAAMASVSVEVKAEEKTEDAVEAETENVETVEESVETTESVVTEEEIPAKEEE